MQHNDPVKILVFYLSGFVKYLGSFEMEYILKIYIYWNTSCQIKLSAHDNNIKMPHGIVMTPIVI